MLFVLCVDADIFYASVQPFISERALDLYNIGSDFVSLFSFSQVFNFSGCARKMATILQGPQGTLKNLLGKGNWINTMD